MADTATTIPSVAPVGEPRDRVDGRAKVTGRAIYAADAPVRNPAHAIVIQSTIARGRITAIDSAAAERAPGVLAVLTPENFPKLSAEGASLAEKRLPLSDLVIHYAGQHVALVVADSLERAQHAATLVRISYATDEPVLSLNDPVAKIEWPAEERKLKLQVQKGDVEKAAEGPGVTVVRQTYSTPVETHNPIEMSATTAYWELGKLTVWDASQSVVERRKALAAVFKLKPEDVRVICLFVGGGFGCKGDQWPHTFLAAAAAKFVNRPVKLVLTRAQMFTSCGHRPVTEQTLTLAAHADGRLVGVKHETKTEDSPVGKHVEICGMASSAIVYATPNLAFTHRVSRVNRGSPTFMRAPGENPGMFALESAMDELAVALGMDPVALRTANHAQAAPYNDLPFSTNNLLECYRLGAEKFGWSARRPAIGAMRAPDGSRLGWGMATATYPAHRMTNQARIRLQLERDAVTAVGACATQDLGTGAYTVCAQMTAMLTGLPFERVRFELGDTDLPPGGVSGGSSTTAGVGQALSEAADKLRAVVLQRATASGNQAFAGLTAADVVFRGGRLEAKDDAARSIALADLLRGGPQVLEGLSDGNPAGADNLPAKQKKQTFQSFGAHFVEVTLPERLPFVRVTRVVSVIDVGRVINPKTAVSQVEGAVIMGIGQALLEQTHYDQKTGRVVNDNLADYLVCVNPDVGSIETHFVGEPDLQFNAIGCRGLGEIGITGIAAAITNAVHHATGVRVRNLPITPDKLMAG